MRRVEALVFDMDGTMVDSMPWHARAWVEFARRRELPVDVPDRGGVRIEDDILVGEHSRGYLRRIMRSLPEEWDVIDITGGVSMDPRGGQAVVNHFFYRVDPPRDRATIT